MKSKIILFMPSVDSGGVEKTFLISDYLAKKCNDIVVISISRQLKNFLIKILN